MCCQVGLTGFWDGTRWSVRARFCGCFALEGERFSWNDGDSVYHNYFPTGKKQKLHNSWNYVNVCNQKHKISCRNRQNYHIFWHLVYIIYWTKNVEKLRVIPWKHKLLDFFGINAIMMENRKKIVYLIVTFWHHELWCLRRNLVFERRVIHARLSPVCWQKG